MFGHVHSSSAKKRLFGSSLCVVCQGVFLLRTSFPRDFGNGMSFSQNSAPFTLSDPAAVPYLLYSRHETKQMVGVAIFVRKSILHLDN